MSAIATTAHGVDTALGLDHDFRVLGFGPIGVTGAVAAAIIGAFVIAPALGDSDSTPEAVPSDLSLTAA